MLFALDHPSFDPIARALAPFDRATTVAVAGGLLTDPAYATACTRLDALANLALLHCRGHQQPTATDLRTWVDDLLGAHPIARLEDPLEDVFISIVATPAGTYRIFEGTWERNDSHLQDAIDALAVLPAGAGRQRLVGEVQALLTLSDEVCGRRKLERWLEPEQAIPRRVVLGGDPPPYASLAEAVSFTMQELATLGIVLTDLAPFIAMASAPARDERDAPPLERRPLAHFGDRLVLASPTSVSAAVRARILDWADEQEALDAYEHVVAEQQAERLFNTLRRDGGVKPAHGTLSLLGDRPAGVRAHENVLVMDDDMLAHVIVLHDDLRDAARDRIGAMAEIPEATDAAIAAYIEESAAALAPLSPGGGMTVLAFAGLGRGRALVMPGAATAWRLAAAGIDDLVMLIQDPEWDLLRVWRLLWHEAMVESTGVELRNVNGLPNLAAYWQHHAFSLVPAYVPYPPTEPGRIVVGSDFVRQLRAQRRREDDVHSIEFDEQRSFIVRRVTARAYFRGLRERPIYAVSDAAGQGLLMGVVETPRLVAWVIAGAQDLKGGARESAYRIWEATLTWLDVLLGLLAPYISAGAAPVHIHLRLDDSAAWDEDGAAALLAMESAPPTAVRIGARAIRVHIAPGFRSLLALPTNEAERALVGEIARQLPDLVGHTAALPWPTTDVLVEQCFRGPDARQMHVFDGSSAANPLARSGTPDPLFVPPEERAAWELGLAWHARERAAGSDRSVDALIEDRDEGVELLRQLVTTVWENLRELLAEFDREGLVRAALENDDELQRDRERWQRTARALTSMPTTGSEAASVAAARESERGIAASACRTLVEMAVCTSPASGGRAVGRGTLGTLMGGIALLLELATNADALHGGPPAPGVRLRPNGYVDVEQPWLEEVAVPFVRESFEEGWRSAVADYERHVAGYALDDAESLGEPDVDASAFDLAFEAEYGLRPWQLIEVVAECIDWGTEREEAVFVVSRAELAERLISRRGLTPAAVATLLSSFALAPRVRWDEAPTGFTDNDWRPWRFRRRLSLLARPFVLLDDPGVGAAGDERVIVAVGQVVGSLSYLISGLRAGWFQQSFVSSRAMRSFLGTATARHGAEFTQRVAAVCRAAGWEARTEVKMTQLGAGVDLGDQDVIAWKEGDPRLLCIECKRLRPARTVYEIFEVLTRFRGQAKDLLARHLARIAWIGAHRPEVARGLRAPVAERTVFPLLVTNVVVPMQFAAGLPLARNEVVAIDQLAAILDLQTNSST